MNGNPRDKDKLKVILVVRNFPILYGTWRFTAIFTNTRQCTDEFHQYLKHPPALSFISVPVVGLPYHPCFGLSSDQNAVYISLLSHACHTIHLSPISLFNYQQKYLVMSKRYDCLATFLALPPFWIQTFVSALWFPNKLMIKISRDWSCSTICGKFQIVGTTVKTEQIMEKLRADWSQGMSATIPDIIFSLPICFQKIYWLKYTETYPCLLFCMDVRLRLTYWGNKVDWECSKPGHWEGYFGLRGRR